VLIVTFFTDNGLPKTGLSPTLRIRNLSTGAIINTVAMDEKGDGFYTYDFTTYDPEIDYGFRADGGAVLSDYDRYTFTTNDTGIIQSSIADIDIAQVNEIKDAILDELLVNHNTAHTVGRALNYMRDFVSGNYIIDTVNHQFILYKEEDGLEYLRFNLFDAYDTPTSTGVFKRSKV